MTTAVSTMTIGGHFTYFVTVFLMIAGLFIVIARGNLIKKLVGLAIFQTSVYLLYIAPGKLVGGTAPILAEGYTQYGPLKSDTAAALIELLAPIQQRVATLDDATVRAALRDGAAKAAALAVPVMARAREAAGLLT